MLHRFSRFVAACTVPLLAGSPVTGAGSGLTQRPPPTRRVHRRTRDASSAGALTVLTKRDGPTMSIHSAGGALVLAKTVAVTLRSFRFSAAPLHPADPRVSELGHIWTSAEATGGRA